MELPEPVNLAPDSSPERAGVLLADDNPTDLDSLRAILGDLGLDLVEARSGEEAIDLAKAQEFAVILLDVRLPSLGGFETAEAIRADGRYRATPIILLADDDIDRDQVERGYALGAVDLLVKPLSPVVVRAKVRGLATLYREKERARHEAEQLRLLVHGTTDYAIFLLDPQGRVASWNPGAERIKGYHAEEIIGQHFSRFYPQEVIDRGWPEHELRVAAAEGRFEDEGWRLRKDCSRFWANVVITALRDERGRLRGFSKVTRDLTERKRAEEDLRRSEERFRLMVEGAKDYAIFMLDPKGLVASWNPGAERIKGYSAQEIIGQHFSRFYPQDVIDRGWPDYELEVAAAEGRFEDEGWRLRKDGSRFWANVVITALKDERGDLLGFSKITRDMTERKRAEEHARRLVEEAAARRVAEQDARLIREQREWLHVTLASIGDAVIATDGEGLVKFLNPVAEGLTGWTQGEAVGRPLEEVFVILNENTRRPVESPVERVIREGVIVGLANHTVVIARGGTETPIEDSAAPIKDVNGDVVGVVMIFQDATQRRRHEAALRESEERHRSILESITDGFYFLDRDWRFTYVNPKAEALLGRSGSDLLGKSVWEEFAFAVGTVFHRDYHRAMDENVAVTSEAFYPPHDRWYEVHAYPSPDGLSIFFRDIGVRKRAEEALQESERRTRAILTSITDAFFAVGLDWRFTYVNPKAERILDRKPGELLGKVLWDEYPGLAGSDFERAYRRAVEERVSTSATAHYPDHDRWYEIRSYPAPDGLSVYFQDVTEKRRQEEALRAAKEEAEDANRAKDDFLAVLSHELRTPLNPILLATTAMIDRPTPPEEFHPTLEMIRQNVNLQARLIDDLLDVMRIVRGKMPLHWGVSDCHDLIGRAVEITRSDALGKNLHLALDLAAEERCVNADAARLQQVFWNLLKNAIKFTPEGGTITVRTRNEGESILIEVADTGIGIEPEILPEVFDAFHQGDARITRKFGGLGLGLAICRGVVEAHGGTIAAESDGKDRGTTFRVAFKTMPVPEDVPGCGDEGDGDHKPFPAASLNRLSILAVDDEPTSLRLMARLLGGLGHRVVTAGTVADAWGAFGQADGFDLIISDIGLPDGSGLDLMRKVKSVRPVPAIALTGYGMDEDIRRSREAGFTTHMTKPIDFTKLEAMIRHVAG